MKYPRIAARLFGAPLLILPDKATILAEVFRDNANGVSGVKMMEDEGETAAQRAEREQARRQVAYAGLELKNQPDKPYALTTSGIALVPVLGTLVQRGSWLDSMSGLASYDTIASQLERAMADPEVRAVLLEIDSPGGEVGGLFDLAGRIRAASQRKPVWSVAAETAYSAGYGLLAAAPVSYAALTGGVGSIGALMLHVNQSKRDSMMGYEYTYIASGAKKAAGNPHEPISDAMLQWAQNEVDRTGALFASTVAKYRGIAVEDVTAAEAGLLTPTEAMDGGYIDGIGSLLEVVSLLNGELQQPGSTAARVAAQRQTTKETSEMTTKAEQDAAAQARAAEMDQIKTAARAEGVTEGEAKGKAEGITAERTRIGGILSCEEAKERPTLAVHLACQTDTTLEAAQKLLAASPKQAAGSGLGAAMASLKNPKVGADVDVSVTAAQPAINTKGIYASRAQASVAARD